MVKNLLANTGRHERLEFDPWVAKNPKEGVDSPLQYSCLENPRDGGAWWAAVYGAAQSQTRLKRLSSSRLYTSLLKRTQSQSWVLILVFFSLI